MPNPGPKPTPDDYTGAGAGIAPARACEFIESTTNYDMCGERTQPGSSYCARHHSICYERRSTEKTVGGKNMAFKVVISGSRWR
jgi:hypothetical protein|tara:strand:+ start:5577 stop:5828 length:252 start_codon:yes stop_codon:yes gene_type:complete